MSKLISQRDIVHEDEEGYKKKEKEIECSILIQRCESFKDDKRNRCYRCGLYIRYFPSINFSLMVNITQSMYKKNVLCICIDVMRMGGKKNYKYQ